MPWELIQFHWPIRAGLSMCLLSIVWREQLSHKLKWEKHMTDDGCDIRFIQSRWGGILRRSRHFEMLDHILDSFPLSLFYFISSVCHFHHQRCFTLLLPLQHFLLFRYALNSVYMSLSQDSTQNSNATNLQRSQKWRCVFCISCCCSTPVSQV